MLLPPLLGPISKRVDIEVGVCKRSRVVRDIRRTRCRIGDHRAIARSTCDETTTEIDVHSHLLIQIDVIRRATVIEWETGGG